MRDPSMLRAAVRARLVWPAIAALWFVALAAGRLALLAYVGAIAALAAGEVYRLARARGFAPVPAIGLLGTAALLFTAHLRGERAPRLYPAVVAAVVIATYGALILRRGRTNATRAVAYTLLPVLVVGLLASYAIVVREARDGALLALALAAMAVSAEAGSVALPALRARAGGAAESWLAPAGALAGGLGGGLSVAAAVGEPLSWGRGWVVGLVVGLAVAAGDTLARLVEADLSHGEAALRRSGPRLLRRVDGPLLAAPAFFYAYILLAR